MWFAMSLQPNWSRFRARHGEITPGRSNRFMKRRMAPYEDYNDRVSGHYLMDHNKHRCWYAVGEKPSG